MKKGLVHIYAAKGKAEANCGTQAALGLALRAKSRGLRVVFIPLVKGREQANYLGLLAELGIEVPKADFIEEGVGGLNGKEALRQLCKMLKGFDLAVIDGFNSLVASENEGQEDALDFIKGKPEELELILTGSVATPQMIEASDLVTEMHGLKG